MFGWKVAAYGHNITCDFVQWGENIKCIKFGLGITKLGEGAKGCDFINYVCITSAHQKCTNKPFKSKVQDSSWDPDWVKDSILY